VRQSAESNADGQRPPLQKAEPIDFLISVPEFNLLEWVRVYCNCAPAVKPHSLVI
jgi:hypothetical protein